MSYLQIEIGGKLRGLKFNQLAHVEYLTITEGQKNPIIHSSALIYAGLYSNCIVKREEPDFTFEDVCDWCEKVTDPQVFYNVLDVYKSTLPTQPVVKKKVVKNPAPQKNIKKRALKSL